MRSPDALLRLLRQAIILHHDNFNSHGPFEERDLPFLACRADLEERLAGNPLYEAQLTAINSQLSLKRATRPALALKGHRLPHCICPSAAFPFQLCIEKRTAAFVVGL